MPPNSLIDVSGRMLVSKYRLANAECRCDKARSAAALALHSYGADRKRRTFKPGILRVPTRAGVVKLADARDSKSRGLYRPCGFDSHLRHQFLRHLTIFPTWGDLRGLHPENCPSDRPC